MLKEPVKKRRHLANTLKCPLRFLQSGSVATEHFMFLPAFGNVKLNDIDHGIHKYILHLMAGIVNYNLPNAFGI